MAEDLNKADVNDLPVLDDLASVGEIERSGTSETPAATESIPPTETSSPEGEAGSAGGQTDPPPSTEDGEPVKPEGTGTEPAAGGEEEPPKETEGATQAAPETTEDQRNTLLSEMTGGRVGTQQDLGAVLEHYEELTNWAKQVQENPKMLLPEGKAQAVYDYVMKQPGENYNGSIQRYYHVLGLGDTKDLSPKEAQFEAYMLKDENADLSREQGKTYFDAEYEKDYGSDPEALKESEPLQYRKHEVATNSARKLISEMQTTFENETSKNTNGQQQQGSSEEEIAQFATQVDKALDDFGGISVAYDKDAKPEDMINFVLDSPEDQAHFSEILKDPGIYWDELLAEHIDAKGNFDTDGFRDAMLIRVFPEKFGEVMYLQGLARGEIANEAGRTPAGGEKPGGETPGGAQPETLEDAFDKALNG